MKTRHAIREIMGTALGGVMVSGQLTMGAGGLNPVQIAERKAAQVHTLEALATLIQQALVLARQDALEAVSTAEGYLAEQAAQSGMDAIEAYLAEQAE